MRKYKDREYNMSNPKDVLELREICDHEKFPTFNLFFMNMVEICCKNCGKGLRHEHESFWGY